MLWVAGYFVEEHPASLHAGWTESWGGVDVRGGVRDTEDQGTFTVELQMRRIKLLQGAARGSSR